MLVTVMRRGAYRKVGTIRFIDGEVRFSGFEDTPRTLFDRVYWFGRVLTPQDSLDYLMAIVSKFSLSRVIELLKEPGDSVWICAWLDTYQGRGAGGIEAR